MRGHPLPAPPGGPWCPVFKNLCARGARPAGGVGKPAHFGTPQPPTGGPQSVLFPVGAVSSPPENLPFLRRGGTLGRPKAFPLGGKVAGRQARRMRGRISECLCRAREGELPRRGKRSWPGPRPRRAAPVFANFPPGDFAACGRRVPLPSAAKEPKRHRGRIRWATAPLRSA